MVKLPRPPDNDGFSNIFEFYNMRHFELFGTIPTV